MLFTIEARENVKSKLENIIKENELENLRLKYTGEKCEMIEARKNYVRAKSVCEQTLEWKEAKSQAAKDAVMERHTRELKLKYYEEKTKYERLQTAYQILSTEISLYKFILSDL